MDRFDTVSIHGWREIGSYDDIVPPIHVSAIYKYVDEEHCIINDRGIVVKYSREENPTVRYLERTIARLENGADALAFTTGMAAISTTLMSILAKGMKIAISMEMYGTTIQLVEELASKIGAKVYKVYPDTNELIKIVDEVDIVFTEIMTNPTLKVIDIIELLKQCKNKITIIDNTFTTPILIKPLDYGATIVVHSTTKYLSGHNDALGGAIVSNDVELLKKIWDWRRMLGTTQQPFEAFLTIRGVKTLSVRFERQCRTAREIAEYLRDHPRVEEVHYPGLKTDPYHSVARKIFSKDLYGAVISFKIKGGFDEARKFISRLKIIRPAPSLGGTESLISLPVVSAAKWISENDRRRLGITENLVRLSIGLEDPEDLKQDLSNALG